MDELKHELFNPPSESDSLSSNNVTEVSETARPGKVTYDGLTTFSSIMR